MDFGFGGKADTSTTNSDAAKVNADGSETTNLDDGSKNNDVNGVPADDINSITDTDKNGNPVVIKDTTKDAGFDNGDGTTKTVDKSTDKTNNDTTNDLVEGSVIEVGEDKYTTNAKGDLVNADGTVFKEAKDVKDWLATFDKVNDGGDKSISISSIQEVVGIEIVGEDEKPIEFENTPDGIKAYIQAVNDATRDEHYEEAINTLYTKYPIINDVLNYYVANGNSLEGFGELQDRSNITIDDSNEAQQESIIRTAFKEQNRKGDADAYIQYLKSSGTLLAVAKEELAGLQEIDNETKAELALAAKNKEASDNAKLAEYWNGVKEAIDKRTIGGYQIPETILISKDGKKIAATPNDFFKYVNELDASGQSAYTRELAQEDKVARRDDELLRAYLKFSGGTYSNLVSMAINKERVATLKLQAKAKTNSSIKITKPAASTGANKTVDFGY